MTTPGDEWVKQRRWRLKPQHASLRVFDELLENEFRPQRELDEWQARAVRSVVRFAAAHTPYYAGLFARLGLRAEDVDGPQDLPRLPPLGKQDVLRWYEDLRSRSLPPGEQVSGATRSSGTTGRPVTVLHTGTSLAMAGFLRQRHARWFGLDPAGTRLDVRNAPDVGRREDGSPNPDGNVVRRAAWQDLGRFFETGVEYAFNVSNPMTRQVAWLRELRPHYAMSFPGIFEEWLLANEGPHPADSLRGLIGIGSQLTPSLRARLEQGYGVPVHQAYGLNEVGMVATRCEAGRYHVHAEHCLVEVVGPDGRPCPPGRTGQVLVTAFRNPAMPLVRYDTGDLAEAAAGPCPCGRTLPAFGEVAGRFRRYAGLPEGTRERVRALRAAVENTPPDQLAFLRRYQIHQDRAGRFTLRLRTVGPIPGPFLEAVRRAWEPVAGSPPVPVAVVVVDDIAPSPSGKLLDFTSDLYTDGYVAPQGGG